MSYLRYPGRSIGRMLMFLREYCRSADYLIFESDGTISLHKKVVVEKVLWDEYDRPTFVFNKNNDIGMSASLSQDYMRDELLKREKERLDFYIVPEEIEFLKQINEKPCIIRINSKDLHYHFPLAKRLVKLGLLEIFEHQRHGFAKSKNGGEYMEFTYEIKLTPEGKGFLQ